MERPAQIRRALEGGRPAQRACAQATRLCTLGRNRRRGNHLAPGGDRRRAQLGLPLFMAARLRLHPRGSVGTRLFAGGARLLLLVTARFPVDASTVSGPLPPRRARRGGGELLATRGLPWLPPRSSRQRR